MLRHVLCVYPYRQELKKFSFCPPLGLEHIGTVVEPYAQALEIIDLRKETKRTAAFLRPETDMVCFSVNWDREIDFLREEILSIPKEILTIIGGRHATNDPEQWFARCPNIKAVVRGDGEEVMEELCRGVPYEQVSGLSFRCGDDIRHNPARKLGNLKDHIYPNRNLRRYTYEIDINTMRTGLGFDSLSASRGCPYNCSFCSFNRNPWGEKRMWSSRAAESIVEELSQIKAPVVGFTDELFTYDMERVGRICDLIVARNIRKKYIINARLEIARYPDVLRKMEQAGFVFLMLGIESAHDKTLRKMQKGFDIALIRKYLKDLRNYAFILHGYFILGNIGESVEDMKQIVPFAHELGVDTLMLSMLRNNPHSGMDRLVSQYSGYHIAPSGKIYSDDCSIKELKRLRRKLYQKFYNKRQMLRILNKALRSGLFGTVTHPHFNAAQFVYSLRKTWVTGPRKSADNI